MTATDRDERQPGETSLSDAAARPVWSPTRPLWETIYPGALAMVDATLVTVACAIAAAATFHDGNPQFYASFDQGAQLVPYSALIGPIPAVWVAVIALCRAYEFRFLGVGSEEFKRIFNATVSFLALITVASFSVKAQLARGFVAVLIPTALILLLLGRFASRKVLHILRDRCRCMHRTVAVGSMEEVRLLIEQTLREPYAGFDVVAVALPDYVQGDFDMDGLTLPNIGPARDVVNRLALVDADTLAVAGTSALSSRELRQLSWDLEGSGTDLLVAPAITDVTGPRIHVRPVAGLPLLHVESPTFGGPTKILKRIIDVLASLLLLCCLALPFLLVALAIKSESPGGVFFRQTRVGLDGSTFRIWKFRSMRPDAEASLPSLLGRNEGQGPLFKIADDPRVTRVGRFLRGYSLDELPQLFNVLAGSMSLVGPRPPLPDEVEVYEDHVHRRLLVKPGMTGLWQVSGRSDLTWAESVRLDLYYVENWSVMLDAQILWKTLFAVVGRRGAY